MKNSRPKKNPPARLLGFGRSFHHCLERSSGCAKLPGQSRCHSKYPPLVGLRKPAEGRGKYNHRLKIQALFCPSFDFSLLLINTNNSSFLFSTQTRTLLFPPDSGKFYNALLYPFPFNVVLKRKITYRQDGSRCRYRLGYDVLLRRCLP